MQSSFPHLNSCHSDNLSTLTESNEVPVQVLLTSTHFAKCSEFILNTQNISACKAQQHFHRLWVKALVFNDLQRSVNVTCCSTCYIQKRNIYNCIKEICSAKACCRKLCKRHIPYITLDCFVFPITCNQRYTFGFVCSITMKENKYFVLCFQKKKNK